MGKHLGFAHISPRLKLAFVIASALVFAGANEARAHEMGAFEVRMTVRDSGDYLIEFPIDPENFLQRLEFLSGGEMSEPKSAEEFEKKIREKESLLLSRFDLRFDGKRSQPRFEYEPGEKSADLNAISATIRLRGEIPAGAKSVTWSYGLIFSRYLFTMRHPRGGESGQRQWIEADAASTPVRLDTIAPPLSRWSVFKDYLVLGFTHIIPKGLDHILFVLGIFLLAPRLRPVLTQVSAFTVAHSITLALSIFGVVSLSPSIVEPLIALSIVYIAFENLFTKQVRPWRVALVFLFGLLHGMGFAGVLSELGLPRSEFLPALIAFNVGVEFGQLSVIFVAWILLVRWVAEKSWYRTRVLIPLSIGIALMGAYWLVERLTGS